MPYIPHYRATAHFNLGPAGTPREEATCTLNFKTAPGTVWSSIKQELVDDMFDDWALWMTTTNAFVSNHVELDQVKLYSIGTDGRIDEDPAISSQITPVRGTRSTDQHPWQCSIVMTLVAGVRGKGRFGRIYLPPQAYPISADGVITGGFLPLIFNATKTLLTNLSNKPLVDAGFALCVAGGTGTGTLREVDEVRMGQVADTQRRRRRSLDEAYVTAAFSA